MEVQSFNINEIINFIDQNFSDQPELKESITNVIQDEFSNGRTIFTEENLIKSLTNTFDWLEATDSKYANQEVIKVLDNLDKEIDNSVLFRDIYSNDLGAIVLEPSWGVHAESVRDLAMETHGDSYIFVIDENDNNNQGSFEKLEKILDKREELNLDPIVLNASFSGAAALRRDIKTPEDFNKVYGTNIENFDEPLSEENRKKVLDTIANDRQGERTINLYNSFRKLAKHPGVKYINKANGNQPKFDTLSFLLRSDGMINTVGSEDIKETMDSNNTPLTPEVYESAIRVFDSPHNATYNSRLAGAKIKDSTISNEELEKILESGDDTFIFQELKSKLLNQEQFAMFYKNETGEDYNKNEDVILDRLVKSPDETVYFLINDKYDFPKGFFTYYFDNGSGEAEYRDHFGTSGASPRHRR
ncbi:MAG: hypothetical protein HRT47_12750 [Candidatus Caenarcaniphilales bacterium]|nr:hypothetical protein [Candidatus Caenarcaniphilales bacterium]